MGRSRQRKYRYQRGPFLQKVVLLEIEHCQILHPHRIPLFPIYELISFHKVIRNEKITFFSLIVFLLPNILLRVVGRRASKFFEMCIYHFPLSSNSFFPKRSCAKMLSPQRRHRMHRLGVRYRVSEYFSPYMPPVPS